MIQGGREKRRAAKTLPGGPATGRRRGLWLMIGFSLVVFVIIVVFETQHELARQQRMTLPGDSSGQAPASLAEAAAAPAAPLSLLGRLKEHYRSHELPHGWVVGGTISPTEDAATVRIVFSPSPQDARYGQSAPREDVEGGAFCPEDAAFWAGLEDRRVSVELGDKNGAIKTIECAAPRQ